MKTMAQRWLERERNRRVPGELVVVDDGLALAIRLFDGTATVEDKARRDAVWAKVRARHEPL